MQMILDPDGFVFFTFKSFDERAAFLKDKVPKGELFAKSHCPHGDDFLVAWKLSELSCCQGFEL